MRPNRNAFVGWGLPAALLFGCLLAPAARASIDPDRLKALRGQAEIYEAQSDWERACETYEGILRLDRSLAAVRERYQHCLRRYWQAQRHSDTSYRKEVLGLDYGQTLRLYTVLVETLLENALDKKKLNPARVFRKGLEELSFALAEPAFIQHHLPGARPDDLRAFRDHLHRTWGNVPVASRPQAVKLVREVALAASAYLNLSTTATVMEFTCGACYALDEYTSYLTPGQLQLLCSSLRGEHVGVGLHPAAEAERLVVSEVVPFSAAAEKGVKPGDRFVSIDRKPVRGLSADAAWGLLHGPEGTTVEVVLESAAGTKRTVALERRPQFVPSVTFRLETESVAYLQITSFQRTTVQELELALATLAKAEVKGLILDLRGNAGGLFDVAVEVARRFLPSGVIASIQNQDSRFNAVLQARNPNAFAAPMVVLVDGGTASAAEVLAGALKENKRARLVGQTTFGKGCLQELLKLPPAPGGVATGGLRITVARFFSPAGSPYTGRGVVPHLFAERSLMPGMMDDMDHQLEEARMEAQRLAAMAP